MKHIILDTDIGGDPDDILALLLALNSSELKVDLVVTNDEYNGNRVRFAKEFFSFFKKQIPIVSGIDLGNEKCFVVDNLIKDKTQVVRYNFLEEIKRIINKNELTHYICIGPQSNLYELINKNDELKNKVKIILMGGAINYRKKTIAEHNFRYDLESAIKVFNSNWDKKYVLSDVTFREEIRIDEKSEFFKNLENSNKSHLNYVAKSMKCFYKNLFPSTYMHDPLTLSYLINEDIIDFTTKKIKLNNKGIMELSKNGKPTNVSISADYNLFWKLFKKRIDL